MRGWNVIITTRPGHYRDALRALAPFGQIGRTQFRDVFVMRVDHPERFATILRDAARRDPSLPEKVARAVPCARTFPFRDVADFEDHMEMIARSLATELGGHRFHVRVHRRGFAGRMHALEEERLIGEIVLDSLAEVGTPGLVAFEDADVVVDVEVVGPQAGVAVLEGREEEGYPFR